MRCTLLVMLFSALVGWGRYMVPGHSLSWAGTYEAFAHIWVGILITMGIYEWDRYPAHRCQIAWLSLFVITAIEVFLFFGQH